MEESRISFQTGKAFKKDWTALSHKIYDLESKIEHFPYIDLIPHTYEELENLVSELQRLIVSQSDLAISEIKNYMKAHELEFPPLSHEILGSGDYILLEVQS